MGLFELVFLSLVQGLTEFLPISSSAHLILVPALTGNPDQGLAFDVAVHFGTLVAVCLYFREDLKRMSQGFIQHLSGNGLTEDGRLMWGVLLGTIPVGLIGLLSKSYIEAYLRGPLVIAFATLFFGILLGLSDRFSNAKRTLSEMTLKDVLVIGTAQAFALIPGTSRSGVTLTAGLFLGLDRQASARFSFLLSIPVIILAAMLETLDVVQGKVLVPWSDLLIAALISLVSAYLCIHYFLKLLTRIGVMPFVIYRLILGVVLIYLFY